MVIEDHFMPQELTLEQKNDSKLAWVTSVSSGSLMRPMRQFSKYQTQIATALLLARCRFLSAILGPSAKFISQKLLYTSRSVAPVVPTNVTLKSTKKAEHSAHSYHYTITF